MNVYYEATDCFVFHRQGVPFVWTGVCGVADGTEIELLRMADQVGAVWTAADTGVAAETGVKEEKAYALLKIRGVRSDDSVELGYLVEPRKELVRALSAAVSLPLGGAVVALFVDTAKLRAASKRFYTGSRRAALEFCEREAVYLDAFTIDTGAIQQLAHA